MLSASAFRFEKLKTPDEQEQIFALFQEEHPALTQDEYRHFLRQNKMNGYVQIGCFAESELIGVVGIASDSYIDPPENYLYIRDLVVSKKWRGRGIGQQLVQRAEALDDRKNAYAWLTIEKEDLVSFYCEKLGYQIGGLWLYKSLKEKTPERLNHFTYVWMTGTLKNELKKSERKQRKWSLRHSI